MNEDFGDTVPSRPQDVGLQVASILPSGRFLGSLPRGPEQAGEGRINLILIILVSYFCSLSNM